MDISEQYSLHLWRKKDRQKSTAAVDSGEASSAMMMAAGLQPTPPTLQTAMVAEPGSTPGPAGSLPPPGNPNFGPYNPGETSPGRWAVQVQYINNHLHETCNKLDRWASSVGIWQVGMEQRVTANEIGLSTNK